MKSCVATLSAIGFALTMQVSRSAQAADPTTSDCLTASDNAVALRNQHKLRAARAQQLVCGAASCPADIRVECLRRVDDLNAAIPTAIFQAKDAAGNDVIAVKVTVDGEPLAERLEGTPISLDPGPHSFTFEMAGQAPVTKTLVIQESQKDRRETIVFGIGALAPPVPATAPAQPGPVLPQPGPGLPQPAQTQREEGLGGQRVLALGAGGVGVAGVVIGTIFGLVASSNWSSAKNDCGSGCGPTAKAQQEKDDANTAATVSTVGFVAGGVLLAAGTALYFTAPSASPQAAEVHLSPLVGPGSAALSLAGRF